jgi:hypothetical protein
MHRPPFRFFRPLQDMPARVEADDLKGISS